MVFINYFPEDMMADTHSDTLSSKAVTASVGSRIVLVVWLLRGVVVVVDTDDGPPELHHQRAEVLHAAAGPEQPERLPDLRRHQLRTGGRDHG